MFVQWTEILTKDWLIESIMGDFNKKKMISLGQKILLFIFTVNVHADDELEF